MQFSKESIHDRSKPLKEKFVQSEFLKDFRELAASTTRGCIVLERPDLLENLVKKHEAQDVTARKTALSELQAMKPRPSQYNVVEQVPEKSLAYKFAKKYWFNDFGAYARLTDTKSDPAKN